MFSFDSIALKGTDHFLMMDRPNDFNNAFEESLL